MARKIINQNSPGTSTRFGGDDTDYINKYLTAVDQSGTDPVDINTTTKFRNQKLQIANPANTFKTTIANDPTTIDQTVYISKVLQNGEVKKVGGWMGGEVVQTYGMYTQPSASNQITFAGGAAAPQWDTTHGRYSSLNTTSTLNSQGGWYGSGIHIAVQKRGKPRLRIKFRLTQTSNTSLRIGFTSANTAVTSADPLANQSGIFLWTNGSTDTQFRIYHNAGDATTNGFSTGVNTDTNVHTFELRVNETNSDWEYSLDDSAFANWVSSDVPADTTALYPIALIQTTAAASKFFDVFWWFVEVY